MKFIYIDLDYLLLQMIINKSQCVEIPGAIINLCTVTKCVSLLNLSYKVWWQLQIIKVYKIMYLYCTKAKNVNLFTRILYNTTRYFFFIHCNISFSLITGMLSSPQITLVIKVRFSHAITFRALSFFLNGLWNF